MLGSSSPLPSHTRGSRVPEFDVELRGNHPLRVRAWRRGPRVELQLEPTSRTLSPDESEPARAVVDGTRGSLKSNLEGPQLFGERIGEFEERDHWALTARVPNARYTCSELAIRMVEFAFEHLFAPRADGWRKWSRQDRAQAREVMADVRRLYAEFARLAFLSFDEAQLAIARRYRPELRWIVYRWMRRDGSGRIAQLAQACPGAVLFGVGCQQELSAPQICRQIDRDARAGRPLDALLGDALERWVALDHGCLEPYCFGEATSHVDLASADAHSREALLRRKRLLLRRMREVVTTEAAVMPPAAAFVPEDIPSERWANARWFRTMSCSAVLVGTNTPWQREIEGLCRLLSREAATLKGSPYRLEDRVRTLANYTLASHRTPSRKTSLTALFDEARRWEARVQRVRALSAEDIDRSDDPHSPPLPNRLDPAEARATLGRKLLDPVQNYAGAEGTVTAIANVGALFEEGRHMCHCVASFATRAMAGTVAYYHAATSEGAGATVELVFGNDRKPLVYQVRGPRNESPTPAVGRLVRAWAHLEHMSVDDLVYGDLADLPETPELVPL